MIEFSQQHDFSGGKDITEEYIQLHKQEIAKYMIENPRQPFSTFQTGNCAILCVRCGAQLEFFVTKNYDHSVVNVGEVAKYRHNKKISKVG